MEKIRYVSGEELVAKGSTKQNTTLPEIGLKNVVPNGSWLEQRQIQSALEARKHLVEVERIEKSGFLSHAEWCEKLQLARVTRQCGGYWQYLGHHQDKQIYLLPEEALFLIEVNCLKLTYNEVTVSLQQAYSLLLRDKITFLKYKVYASLSRVGYKLYRHTTQRITDSDGDTDKFENTYSRDLPDKPLECASDMECNGNNLDDNKDCRRILDEVQSEIDCNVNSDRIENGETEGLVKENVEKSQAGDDIIIDNIFEDNIGNFSSPKANFNIVTSEPCSSSSNTNTYSEDKIHTKLKKLLQRNQKTIEIRLKDKFFEKIPDFTRNPVVTIDVPDETYLPRNIFLHNLNYKIDLEQLKAKPSCSESTRTYSASDVNAPEVRRVRNTSTESFTSVDENYNTPQFNAFPRFYQNRYNFQNRYPLNFRSFGFQRPPNYHLIFNLLLQRPMQQFIPAMHQFARHQPSYFARVPRFYNLNQFPQIDPRQKRRHTSERERYTHLGTIKRLALKLKKLVANGYRKEDNVNALNNLISTYNDSYGCKVRLNENYDLIIDNNLVETIELEADIPNKKQRLNSDDKLYEDDLNIVSQLAAKLKCLEDKAESTSRLRRGFSNLVKKFNESFNADIYLDSNYKVHDRNNIVIDSSDSDCTVDDEDVKPQKKLVRNPFSSKLKTLELSEEIDGYSANYSSNPKYDELKTIFGDWLPKEDDFGTAYVAHKKYLHDQLMAAKKEQYIYEFLKNCACDFDNWVVAKMSFWENVEFEKPQIQDENSSDNDSSIDSIVKPDDCKDMASVLDKLRIIKTCKSGNDGLSSLRVDFDGYNKDVQNFRKSNKPKPHFRIVCVDATEEMPSGSEITSLHSRYTDNVPIVFAVVMHDAISYIQMNPADIPVYIPSCELP